MPIVFLDLLNLMTLSLLELAADSSTNKSELPSPEEVVANLLDAEKTARKKKLSNSFEDLIGTWRLRFITGTKQTRKKAGIVLGAGRYLPRLIKIQITYARDQNKSSEMGKVENSVQFAFLNLSLTGPAKFLAQKNILAFDFTAITVAVFGLKLYQGYIRGGKRQEKEFYQTKISKQAFFAYFLIQENFIAARGKGGGLALWNKNEVREN